MSATTQKIIYNRQRYYAKRGIMTLTRAAIVIERAMMHGATFDDAYAALLDVMDANGLRFKERYHNDKTI